MNAARTTVGIDMSDKLFDVIDFEASSLGAHSYPIELGWTNGPNVRSVLIKPIAGWTDWDDYAETKIHHISRAHLEAEGVSPAEALQMINDDFGSGILWCDGGKYDAWWLTRLEEGAGFKATFRLGDIYHMLDAYHGVTDDRFYAAKAMVQMQESILDKVQTPLMQPHRAGYDAMMIKKALYSAIGYY